MGAEHELDRDVVDRYAAGATTLQIANELGISRREVNAILKRCGVSRRPPVTAFNLPTHTRDRVIRLHAQHMPATEVSRITGLDPLLIRQVWQSVGLPTRVRARNAPKQEPAKTSKISRRPDRMPKDSRAYRDWWIVSHYQDGESTQTIASALGIGRGTVRQVLATHGVQMRPARKPRKLSNSQELDLVQARTGGATIDALAGQFGVSVATVRDILHRHQVPARASGARKLAPDQERDVVKQYRAGTSTTVLAEQFGVAERTVLATIRRDGQKTRPPGKPGKKLTKAQEREVAARYVTGQPVKSIAADCGISRQRVSRIAEKLGVPPRKKRRAPGTVKRRGGKRDPRRSAQAPEKGSRDAKR